MRKETLRKLRTLNATPAIIKRAGIPPEPNEYGHEMKRYYAMLLRCQTAGPYLKIAVFLPEDINGGIRSPRFEIYINPEGGEYITRILKNGKETGWSRAKIGNLPYTDNGWAYLYWSTHNVWINPEGAKTIRKMLNVSKGGYEGIREYQNRISENRIREQEKRETAPWDADMALVPEPPKGFHKWWKKHAIKEDYIFYEYGRNIKKGWCSFCEREVPVSGVRNNKTGTCSRCGREVTYKSSGKIKTLATERYDCQLMQTIPGGFVLQGFECWRSYAYDRDYHRPKYYLHEYRRVVFRDGTVSTYIWGLYKNKTNRWIRPKWDYARCEGPVYPRTLPGIRKKITHTGLFRMLERYPEISIEKYIKTEDKHPVMEKLVKAGCLTLAEDLMDVLGYGNGLLEEKETELAKILKLDKARLKRLREEDGNINLLAWLQREKTEDTIYPRDMLCYFADNQITAENISFLTGKMTYEKIYNYLVRQQSMTGGKPRQLLTTWRDYLNMAGKLNMNLDKEMIYKPKHLKQAHDELVLVLQGEEIKEQADERRKEFPKAEGVLKTLGKYEYKDKAYSITAPKSIEDIIREGTVLRHCVHTCDFYFDRISRQETYLLFLRRADSPETSWYTLEVEPSGNIRQKRTTGDNQNDDIKEALPFLKKWQKEIQKRLSGKDKELGKKSNELRKQEYAKLKQDGNRIWHGMLQGQLLADVLEADFMAFENA